jgi:hypothetical protein
LNDEKIISQPQLELVKMECPVSRRAFSSPKRFLERFKSAGLASSKDRDNSGL